METPLIEIKTIGSYMPEPATPDSAGVDLRAMIKTQLTIYPGQTVTIETGIAIHINDTNIVGILLPRSGLGCQGIVLGNGTGVIDSGYQGEIKACLWNRGEVPLNIKPNDRICQLLFMPVIKPHFKPVQQFSANTERGTGGFGSTGAS